MLGRRRALRDELKTLIHSRLPFCPSLTLRDFSALVEMTKWKELSANRLWKRCTTNSRNTAAGTPRPRTLNEEQTYLLPAMFWLLNYFTSFSGLVSLVIFGIGFSGYSFAALVAYRAARFAGGLASRPAFAAACDLLFSGFCYRSYHFGVLLFRHFNIYFLYYIISACKNQVFLQAEIRRRAARRNNFARQPFDRSYARLRLTASTPVIPPAKAHMSASSSCVQPS